MLEKPALQDSKITACLQEQFGLPVAQFTFLPLGADVNTAVYRAAIQDGKPYFVKLRRGNFNETSVTLPEFLHRQGIPEVIAPLHTQGGNLWAELENFKVIVYPFIDGHNGYEIHLSNCHWRDFGAVLRRLHTTPISPTLVEHLRRENFSACWRDVVKESLARIGQTPCWALAAVQQLADYLRARQAIVCDLLQRSEQYAQALRAQPPEFVLCHADVHAGNVLIGEDGRLYIVDWDTAILAPKERDLMYPGAGLFSDDRTPQEEETLFYDGYGPANANPLALAYYRYERILEDIAAYCQQFFSASEESDDLAQSFRYLESNFLPHGTIEIAYRADRT